MSRQYPINIVGVDFSAPDGERQVPETDGIKPGSQTAVEHEYAAARVASRVQQVAVDGQAIQLSVVVQAADHDGVAGRGQRRRIGQRPGAGILGVRSEERRVGKEWRS